jgi:superfamily I DNA/RNA helicase
MSLNQAQNQVVEHTDSSLLLVAVLGSGKTRVMIERIKFKKSNLINH